MATTQASSDIIIRSMQEHDIDRIAAIENSAYYAPWPKAAFSASLGKYPAFVMQKKSQLMGYALFTATQDEAHIINFVIAPEYQGQGLGRVLLQFIMQRLQQQQVTHISLEVALNNHAAIHLYQKFGFKRAGVRKQYYQTALGREDALILVYKSSYTVNHKPLGG